MTLSVHAERIAARYAKCIEMSKRARWDIDDDVLRGRSFDTAKKFLPDGLSRVDRLGFLSAGEQRLMSQVQGRTYAGVFGLVERFIGAKVLDLSQHYWFGDQLALEALVRFTDEELKHQRLFRKLETMMADVMPGGYRFDHDVNAFAAMVLSRSSWAVLALTCHIELFTQDHYKQSIEPDSGLSEVFKDVFLYHWKEEAQHTIVDELEWTAEDRSLSDEERDHALDELIALLGALDALLEAQATADVAYFGAIVGRALDADTIARLEAATLDAYRFQYIVSGVRNPRFAELLSSMLDEEQRQRFATALGPLVGEVRAGG